MSKCWLLIGNISGNVGYGVDESFYLFGIYDNEDMAASAMKSYKESEMPVVTDNGDMLFQDEITGEINSGAIHDQYYDERPDPITYHEFTYKIIPFSNSPIFLGGASYIE